MKYLPFLLLLTVFACDKEDAGPTAPDNEVRVYLDGELYFTQENNLFNAVDRDINSDGTEEFTFLLFATGKNDEDENFALRAVVSSTSNPSEYLEGSISFTQIGNDCSGTLVALPENVTVDIDTEDGNSRGVIVGTFTNFGGNCGSDFRIEFEGIESLD